MVFILLEVTFQNREHIYSLFTRHSNVTDYNFSFYFKASTDTDYNFSFYFKASTYMFT